LLTARAQLQVNSFNREDEDLQQAGMFVNAALAMVNHSCVPNAFVQFIGRKAVLRANRAIKDEEEIEISYIGMTTAYYP
jgi:SET domain-containing protein